MKKINLSDIFINWFTLIASLSLLSIFALWIWFSSSDLNALLESKDKNPPIPSDPPTGATMDFAPVPTLVMLIRPDQLNTGKQSVLSGSTTQPTPTIEVLRSISAPTPPTKQNNSPVVEQVVIGQPAPAAPSGGDGTSKSHSSSKSS